MLKACWIIRGHWALAVCELQSFQFSIPIPTSPELNSSIEIAIPKATSSRLSFQLYRVFATRWNSRVSTSWAPSISTRRESMLGVNRALSEEEKLHLIESRWACTSEHNMVLQPCWYHRQTSTPDYTPALVYDSTTNEAATDGEYRRSETALIRGDSIVKGIEKRAQYLQQWTNMAFKPLSVQRYQKDGYFLHHLDVIGLSTVPDRKSTFNVWLEGNCIGGGTQFPMIPPWEDPALCAFLDCNDKRAGLFSSLWPEMLYSGRISPRMEIYGGNRFNHHFRSKMKVNNLRGYGYFIHI